MSAVRFSHEEIVREAKFSPEDMTEIKKRRRDHTCLGFAYNSLLYDWRIGFLHSNRWK